MGGIGEAGRVCSLGERTAAPDVVEGAPHARPQPVLAHGDPDVAAKEVRNVALGETHITARSASGTFSPGLRRRIGPLPGTQRFSVSINPSSDLMS